jgi:hypothetical protein
MVAMLERAPSTVTHVYGIATDYMHWRFMKLDRQSKKIVCSNAVSFLVLSNKPKVLEIQSVIVFAYLFEVFGIPVDIDMEGTIGRVLSSERTNSDQLIDTVCNACNVVDFRRMLRHHFL